MKSAMSMCTNPGTLALALALSVGTAVAQQGGAPTPQQPSGQAAGANSPGGLNSAATMNGMNGMSTNGASMQDKMFLKNAAAGDMFEIQTSQLALQKSNSADVKQFAQMMIDDHTKLDNQMKPIATEAGVQPPTQLTGKERGEYKKLQGLSGDDFDKEYIKAMVDDHTKVSKAFGSEIANGTLPDEKMAAQQNKPTVDMHLQKAQQLAQAHNVSAGM